MLFEIIVFMKMESVKGGIWVQPHFAKATRGTAYGVASREEGRHPSDASGGSPTLRIPWVAGCSGAIPVKVQLRFLSGIVLYRVVLGDRL